MNAYSWKPQWKADSGGILQSRTVAQDVQKQDSEEESDSHLQCCIRSQPKNRTAPTTSVHLAPETGFNSFQNEMYILTL